MYVFGGIILVIIGLVMIRFPEAFYRLTQSWKNSTTSDPSHKYILATKFGGIMFFIIGILSIIVQFI
jgi:hypothetical protein